MKRLLVILVAILVGQPSAARADEDDSDMIKAPVEWGIGAKVRRWYVANRVQRLFIKDGPKGRGGYGAGIDFSRRVRNTEFSFGFGYDQLDLRDGYYLEKGGVPTMAGDVEYTTFNSLEWYTAEVVVVSHVSIHKLLELRFGAGIGIGWMRGTVRQTDALCTGDRLQRDCMIDPAAVDIDKPANIPPVLPVLNLLVGLQLRPFRFLHVYVDAGLHSTPYLGVGATLYLW